jgi:WG containing repeat
MRDANSNNGGVVFGYLDRNGKLVIPPVFSMAEDFAEKLAPVQSANGAFGYITPDGNWAIPPVFRNAESFSEGWAVVRGSRLFNDWGYIDVQGREQLRLPGPFIRAGSFRNGKASMQDWNNLPFVIDKSGKTVAADAPVANPPAESTLQRLSVNGGKWGYADAQDRFVIAPQFDDAGEFSEDHAPVRIGKKWGYVHRSGKIAIRATFDDVGKFSEGLAPVKDGELWTFIDLKGKPITTEALIYAGDFHDGLARVGMELNSAKRRAAGEAWSNDKPPNFTPNWPSMLSEGGDMRAGITWIKLVSGGYFDYYLMALLNKQGELVIPATMPARPPATQK